ncbi:MAG: hypothetical protein RL189_804 [Pseudomonadota bacterium]|jgi:membrane associated rhomboid family serine protease
MVAKHLEEETPEHQLGLVLKGSVYQATFEYRVDRSESPWVHVPQDSLNAAKLLMRILPLKTLSTSLLYATIVAMISIFVWSGAIASLGVSRNLLFLEHDWWRVFSAQFQHADSKHLLNNLLPFVGLGWLLWGYFGLLAFPLVPVLAGAVANFVAVLTYPPEVQVIGLSGTVFAMAGLWAALYIKNDFRFTVGKRVLRAAGFILVLFFPLSLEQNVSDRVHILGGLAGLAAGFSGWGKIRPQVVSAQKSSAERVRVP